MSYVLQFDESSSQRSSRRRSRAHRACLIIRLADDLTGARKKKKREREKTNPQEAKQVGDYGPNLRIVRDVVVRLAVRTGGGPVIRDQGSHNNKCNFSRSLQTRRILTV